MESRRGHYIERSENMESIQTNWRTSIVSQNLARILRYKVSFLLLLLLCCFAGGCGVYSFTGASIPPEAKTISITSFQNKAEIVQPALTQMFSEKLRDRFSTQTNLNLVPRNGDLHLEGEITGYSTSPVAISGQQQASLIELKITVNVRFFNKFDPKTNFETSFSRYERYESNLNLTEVEESLIATITDVLVDDIFNKSVVNW